MKLSHSPDVSPPLATSPSSDKTSCASATDHIEIPPDVSRLLTEKGLSVDDDAVVQWRANAPQHPRHWSTLRRSYDTAIIILLEFITTFDSNAPSAINSQASADFGISPEATRCSFLLTYFGAQAIGILIFPPLVESFGGRSIYAMCTVGFTAACVAVGACPTILPVVIVARFISGFLSAMPTVAAASSIENMWDSRARIWVVHLWISGAIIGISVAPALTTLVRESHLKWHWIFYFEAMAGAVLIVMCSVMRESRPSRRLRIAVQQIAAATDFHRLIVSEADRKPDASTFLHTSLTLPVRLFFCEPIVFLTSIMGACVYGISYLFTSALADVYVEAFAFTELEGSLVFLAIGVGVILTVLPRFRDVRVTDRKGGALEPEDNLFGFYIAAPVLAVGIWWFAFTVPPLTHGVSAWSSICSLALFGYSVVEFDNVLSCYLCETYASRSASALAPLSFLRALLSGTFPLFGTQLFKKLGASYAMIVLAVVATIFCGVALFFRLYGKVIRRRSPLAEQTQQDDGTCSTDSRSAD